jgi:hypothetical protein
MEQPPLTLAKPSIVPEMQHILLRMRCSGGCFPDAAGRAGLMEKKSVFAGLDLIYQSSDRFPPQCSGNPEKIIFILARKIMAGLWFRQNGASARHHLYHIGAPPGTPTRSKWGTVLLAA